MQSQQSSIRSLLTLNFKAGTVLTISTAPFLSILYIFEILLLSKSRVSEAGYVGFDPRFVESDEVTQTTLSHLFIDYTPSVRIAR